jgi:hypothetical protein
MARLLHPSVSLLLLFSSRSLPDILHPLRLSISSLCFVYWYIYLGLPLSLIRFSDPSLFGFLTSCIALYSSSLFLHHPSCFFNPTPLVCNLLIPPVLPPLLSSLAFRILPTMRARLRSHHVRPLHLLPQARGKYSIGRSNYFLA